MGQIFQDSNNRRQQLGDERPSMPPFVQEIASSSELSMFFSLLKTHIQFGILFRPNIVPLCNKSLGQNLTNIFSFTEGPYLTPIKVVNCQTKWPLNKNKLSHIYLDFGYYLSKRQGFFREINISKMSF